MQILTRTITCNLPYEEDVLERLEIKHKEQPFKEWDDVVDTIHDMILEYTYQEAYDFFYDEVDDYANEIADTFLKTHSEIEKWWQ